MEGIPIILVILGVGSLMLAVGFHKIEEGHVGVYFRGGALLEETTEPGYHWMLPFITSYENVQVTVQTDKVTNIPVYISLSFPLVWYQWWSPYLLRQSRGCQSSPEGKRLGDHP